MKIFFPTVLFAFLLIQFQVIYHGGVNCYEDPVVKTIYGKIRGSVEKTASGKIFHVFQSIPFAKPPIGNLRFQKPEPPEPWEGVRNARRKLWPCTQYTEILNMYLGREDCLYLSVYIPQVRANKLIEGLPVIFYIQGGGFQYAFSDSNIYGPQKLMERNVILVTANYRVGVLGFLSTGDDEVPGNNGIRDMISVLEWIQNNIAQFGGNPNKVTVMSESAGAIAVSIMLLTDRVKGLFQQAILQSGAFYFPALTQRNPRAVTEKFAEETGCLKNSTADMMACLRQIPDVRLVQTYTRFGGVIAKLLDSKNRKKNYFHFLPTVNRPGIHNDEFLSIRPDKFLREGRVYKVPIILGTNANEGAFFVEMFANNEKYKSTLNFIKNGIEDYYTNFIDYPHAHQVIRRLQQEYLGNLDHTKNKEAYVRSGTMIISDFLLTVGCDKFASAWSSLNLTTYRYVMKYKGRHAVSEIYNRRLKDAGHGDEMIYLFENIFQRSNNFNAEDEKFSHMFLNYVINFANSGNPNSENTPVLWEQFSEQNQKVYLEMDKDFSLKSNYRARVLHLWNVILPKIGFGLELTEEEQEIASYRNYLP